MTGHHPGLTEAWRVGRATLTPGRIDFRLGRFDHPFAKVRRAIIYVTGIDAEPRPREGRGKWRLSGNEFRPEMHTFRLQSDGVAFDLALLQYNSDAALRCLGSLPPPPISLLPPGLGRPGT